MPAEQACSLMVSTHSYRGASVLAACGTLDSATYRTLRDTIIKAALDEPMAVIVDVDDLAVPAGSAWAVFTSARWHVDRWPEIPIIVVCSHAMGRAAIARNGITRYVPVYASVDDAMAALGSYSRRHRRRARAALPQGPESLRRSRELVECWLTAWSKAELVAVSKIIVTTLVENVLQHTDGPPSLRLESKDDTVVIAVEDGCRTPPALRETRLAADMPTGLRIVGLLTRLWGTLPTPSGKTIWAVIGPENRL
ncbi:STAS domain-containing protein [Mycobacterium sp. 1274761.0]|uniref:STAS domain-containing protein n=1 Tax=Mycobacterium sp. 1274761.0 TaxID=1834077 RepID=UPI001E479CF5|nr:STAS domain-containing protein [Mycobacterium sp. 1274761.0]